MKYCSLQSNDKGLNNSKDPSVQDVYSASFLFDNISPIHHSGFNSEALLEQETVFKNLEIFFIIVSFLLLLKLTSVRKKE